MKKQELFKPFTEKDLINLMNENHQKEKETRKEHCLNVIQKSLRLGIYDALTGLTGIYFKIDLLWNSVQDNKEFYQDEKNLVLNTFLEKEPVSYVCNFKLKFNEQELKGNVAFTPSLFIAFYELMLGGEYEGSFPEKEKAYENLKDYLKYGNLEENENEFYFKEMLTRLFNSTFMFTIIKEQDFELELGDIDVISTVDHLDATENSIPIMVSYYNIDVDNKYKGLVSFDFHFDENDDFVILEELLLKNHLKENELEYDYSKLENLSNKTLLLESCPKCGCKDFEIIFKHIDYDKYYFSKKEYVKNCENYIKKENTHSYAKDCYVVKEHLVCYCKTCGYAEAIDTKDNKC